MRKLRGEVLHCTSPVKHCPCCLTVEPVFRTTGRWCLELFHLSLNCTFDNCTRTLTCFPFRDHYGFIPFYHSVSMALVTPDFRLLKVLNHISMFFEHHWILSQPLRHCWPSQLNSLEDPMRSLNWWLSWEGLVPVLSAIPPHFPGLSQVSTTDWMEGAVEWATLWVSRGSGFLTEGLPEFHNNFSASEI
jgi:hypothetical protein